MRLRLILTAVAVVAWCFGAVAQILYKVEKPGNDNVSYLLGTHHLAPLAVIDSIAELPEILRGVDKLYGELDMSEMTNPSALLSMQQKMMAPSDSTLDKVLTAEDLSRVQQVFGEYAGSAFPLQQLYVLKPSVLMTQLVQLMTAKAFPELADPLQGMDITMQTRARELGKPVMGLETIEFQIDLLYGTPISGQADELMKLVTRVRDKKHSEKVESAA